MSYEHFTMKKKVRSCHSCKKETLHTFVFTFEKQGGWWCENAPNCIDGSFASIRSEVKDRTTSQYRQRFPKATGYEIEEMFQEQIRRAWGLANWRKVFANVAFA